MVTNPVRRLRDRNGKTRLGTLLVLLLVVAGIYYGLDWGQAYFRYWSLQEAMQSNAGLATGLDNPTIRRRLLRKIDELGLPEEAKKNMRIRRNSRPHEIVINTSYVIELPLPFVQPYIFTFKPEAKYRL